ncbi:hypothetical protein C8F04DRAFT_1200951 [Mycena alexandri]|uniref:Uncharacterized protein n=1 Tax=Mycena alexandri TaxID=1745969 RepID=A0AAD6RZB8_9AGAR|nr:hypothetical protein C8F04DRAFT_1200951 [Mycena alexandri]
MSTAGMTICAELGLLFCIYLSVQICMIMKKGGHQNPKNLNNYPMQHIRIPRLRHDTADRLNSLHLEIEGSQAALVSHISDNLTILRELGASTKAIGHAIAKMGDLPLSTPKMAKLPEYRPGDEAEIAPSTRAELDHAFPPRSHNESTEEFHRRAQFALDGRRRAASAFAFDTGPTDSSTARVQQRAETYARMNPANKSLRFEDPGSISMTASTAPQPAGLGFGPDTTMLGDAVSRAEEVLEEYHAENDRKIAAIIHRQVGEVLEVPSRIKAPKLASPPLFSGNVNDPSAFLTYIETVTTWMRAQFMGGAEADIYRVTLLKTLLTSNALEWFIEHVEGQNGPSTVPYKFTSVVCALHRRFITFATAEKASRAFDQVRYKAEDGPTKFMDDLVSASRKMREPMPDFVIRQRFMRLIPEKIREHLVLHKGLNEVYSTIQQLRFHATYMWDVNSALRSTSSLSSQPTRTTLHPNQSGVPTPRRAPRVEGNKNPALNTPNIPASRALATTGSDEPNPHATKRCFKCGALGHIGSDPACPKNTGQNRARVGLAAHRVVDSYAEDDFPEAGVEGEDEETPKDWGGSQYEPEDEHDPNEAPALTDLIDIDQEEEPRVGAMQIRYFSMQLTLPDVDPSPSPERLAWIASLTPLEAELAGLDVNFYEREPDALFGASAVSDVERLNEARTDIGLAEFTPEEYEAKRLELVMAHSYPVDIWTTFEELAYEFQAKVSTAPWSRAVTEEWDIILAYNAFEHARRDFQAIRIPRWEVIIVTSNLLEGRREPLEELGDRIDELVASMVALRNQITTQRLAATAHFTELQDRRNPSPSRAAQVYRHTRDSYEQLLLDMQAQEDALRARAIRTQSFRQLIATELNRRDEPPRVALTQRGLEYLAAVSSEAEGSRATTPESPPPGYRAGSDSTYLASASPPVSESEMRSERPGPTHSAVVTLMVNSAITGTSPLQDQGTAAEEEAETDEFNEEAVPQYALTDPLAHSSPDVPTAGDEPSSPDSDAALWAELPALEEAEDVIDGATGLPALTSTGGLGSTTAATGETESEATLAEDAEDQAGARGDEESPTIRLMSHRLLDSEDLGVGRAGLDEQRLGEINHPEHVQAVQAADVERFRQRMADDRLSFLGRAAAWEETPGILLEPQNPDEPLDERRVWINGVGADYGDRFVSVLDTLGTSDHSPDQTPDAIEVALPPLSGFSGLANPTEQDIIVEVSTRRDIPEPSDDDALIIRSVVQLFGSQAAELYLTYVDRNGTVYIKTQPLSPLHYLSPEMVAAHQEAMDEAIRNRAEELNCPIAQTFHERVATLGPEDDDEDAFPGFRVQALAQQVERVSRIHRPDSLPSVGLVDQPSRKLKDIACLTAEVEIGGCTAYILFDSGSNTDSLTPEYAKGTECAVFRLEEQVTLQLGCVGSKSRINYGARAPVSFGGIKGHTYFDIVNVDRYDGIIGAPFMIKHKAILDFGKREIRFPNGHAIAALAIADEMALSDPRRTEVEEGPLVPPPAPILQRRPLPPAEVIEIDDDEHSTLLPSLPHDHPLLMILEADFITLPPSPVASSADVRPPTSSDAAVDHDDIPPLQEDDGEDYSDNDDGEAPDDVEPLPTPPIYMFVPDNPRNGPLLRRSSRQPERMPGLLTVDYVSVHSSQDRVSSTGEADPHGINNEAFDEAVNVIHPELEDMTRRRTEEVRAEIALHARRVRDPIEERVLEAQEMEQHAEELADLGFDTTAISLDEALQAEPPTSITTEGDTEFLDEIRRGYPSDSVLGKVVEFPEAFPQFEHRDGLLYCRTIGGRKSLKLRVKWTAGDITWEPPKHLEECAALDDYFEAMGVQRWQDLPRLDGPTRRTTSKIDTTWACFTIAANSAAPGRAPTHTTPGYMPMVCRSTRRCPRTYPNTSGNGALLGMTDTDAQRLAAISPPSIPTVPTAPVTATQARLILLIVEDEYLNVARIGQAILLTVTTPPPEPLPDTLSRQQRPRTWNTAEEERLRRNALRTKRGPWVRTVFPPDVHAAEKDSDGHPICPLECATNDPNDYGSDDEIVALPPNWNARKSLRRTEALQTEGADAEGVRLQPSGEAGMWRTLSVTTVHQAENVLRWVRRTEPSALAYMTHIAHVLKSNPALLRTAGEIYLLAKENSARATYWLLATGNKKPPKAIPLEQQTSTNFDNSVQVYLGAATMGDNDTIVLIAERGSESSVQSGTHLKLNIAISLYEQMFARDWPLGMRITATRFANIMVVEYASPYPPDVAAWYTINALCPRRTRKGTSIQRHKFFELLMRILSVGGAFFRIATFSDYRDADLPLEHYPFRTDNITSSLVVSWLIQHGIKKDGDAVRILEDFARARRNLREGRNDPSGTTFKSGDWPRDSAEVLTLREDEVTKWADLEHAMVQDHVTTSYPQRPADTMEDDGQA